MSKKVRNVSNTKAIAVQVLTDTLSDGSKVYSLAIGTEVFNCAYERDAIIAAEIIAKTLKELTIDPVELC